MIDPYFSRPEVSNSDLSALKKLLYGGFDHDPTKAYADGHLLDAMITENHKVDYFKRTLNGYTYSADDFDNTRKMQKVFYKDQFGKMVLEHCSFQHVSVAPEFKMNYNGYEFTLPARCKWDFLFPKAFKMGGDIKSTAAETQDQFEAACEYFDYFRSRAWYMDIEGTDKDMLVGISKKNHKIFKIAINRGDKYHQKGKEQYTDLAFKWWQLFDGLQLTA